MILDDNYPLCFDLVAISTNPPLPVLCIDPQSIIQSLFRAAAFRLPITIRAV